MNFSVFFNHSKNDFISRLKVLIKKSAPYLYPEKKTDYIPNFRRPFYVEKSWWRNKNICRQAFLRLEQWDIDGLAWTYSQLADEYSREIMLHVLVYNLFDEVRLRFPLYYSHDYDKFLQYESMALSDEVIDLWFNQVHLKKYDLHSIGSDLKLWYSIEGIYIDFIREQYHYKNILTASLGDVVIDGGGCYGDTALYFASKTQSKVYSFEFMPENLEIFNKNLQLNPTYAKNVILTTKPLGRQSGDKVYAAFNGPGTSVTDNKLDGSNTFESISIDDFILQNNIDKIDFIKLDVEGSEAATLEGAKYTIQKFKPKLAICAYHKKEDLWTLPQLIKRLLPEYKLYLDHHTIVNIETVIYAIVQS